MSESTPTLTVLDQPILIVTPDKPDGITIDLIETQLFIETKGKEKAELADIIPDLQEWLVTCYGLELTFSQAWQLLVKVREAFVEFKKKFDLLPKLQVTSLE